MCDPSILKPLGLEASEARSGRGVRIKAPDDFSLAKLPRGILEKLASCDVVELEYPDGRVVYVRREWLERVLKLAVQGSSGGR